MRFFAGLAIIGVAFTMLLIAPSSMPTFRVSKALLGLETSIGFSFALLAGIFLTADCLSFEKREGTLGLIFLTDLNGFDVVLGKLASSSVQCFYALLAIFPMLGLPLLLGGVTPGEFWRINLALLTTMMLSLVTGIVASSVCREARQTMVMTFAFLAFTGGILPLIPSVEQMLFKRAIFDTAWLVPSPYGALTGAFDSTYRTSRGWLFWTSIMTLWGLSLAGLAAASYLLPRRWQEKGRTATPVTRRSLWRRVRFASDETPARRPLPGNPFVWLSSRDRMPNVLAWTVVGVIGAVWLGFFRGSWGMSATAAQRSSFIVCMFVAVAAHVLFKAVLAIEATRRFSEDRLSGALELVLVTPVRPAAILQGQRSGLRRHFLLPMLGLMVINAGLVWLAGNARGLSINGRDLVIFDTLFIGGAALLWIDVQALIWVGMRSGLRATRQAKAVWATLLRVMMPPWLGVVLIVMIGISGRNLSAEAVQTMFTLWILLSAIYSAATAAAAKADLFRNFRRLASGGIEDASTKSVARLPGLELRFATPGEAA